MIDPYTPVATTRTRDGWLSLYRGRSDSLQVVRHDGTYDKHASLDGDQETEATYYGFEFVVGSESRVVAVRWRTPEDISYPVRDPQPVGSVPEDVRTFLTENGYTVVDAERVPRGNDDAYREM